MAHWIAELRKEHGLTQVTLAKGLGINESALSRIERGLSAPSYQTLTKLCEIFGTEKVSEHLPDFPGIIKGD